MTTTRMIRNTILAFVAALTVAAGLSVSTASAADSRSSYTNGCTLSPDGIPGFYNFRDICNQHDVCYARFSNGSHQYGTNEWGRLTCDNQFLSNMNNYCYNRFAWYDPRRNTCLSSAGTYYSAVRRLGAPFYYDYNLVY